MCRQRDRHTIMWYFHWPRQDGWYPLSESTVCDPLQWSWSSSGRAATSPSLSPSATRCRGWRCQSLSSAFPDWLSVNQDSSVQTEAHVRTYRVPDTFWVLKRTSHSGKELSCTHSELVCDGTANISFSLHGVLTFDLSCKVHLRWLGLSGKTEKHR